MNRAGAVAELKDLWAALSSDQEAAVAYGKESNTPYAQRALIRANFALMEGLSYQLRAVTLASLQSTEFLTEGEIALLREERYTIDEKGEPQTKESFLRFPESLLFSIRMYVRNHGADFEPDIKSSGWQAMRKAAKVRNRVTHPKSAASLALSSQDLAAIQEAQHGGRPPCSPCLPPAVRLIDIGRSNYPRRRHDAQPFVAADLRQLRWLAR